ncbi:tRNA(fMet)-specific endonuclease VapC [Neolewinella maritima]|uniref:Ribonuclease VapC n=1 Tax=Neolewinella maritima TaxID=1383882 RepID=A0ABN8EZM0_9BACT|nr:PIN domain-containing protein [Neolewinella maritima]CAH0999379.1 tRNA(fMet)-specific endonuclease VapC [Neolewinella maritima]
MAYILDTDICIFYLKGKFNLGEKVGQIGEQHCYISEITLLELTYGAYNSAQFEKHLAEAIEIEQLFEVLPIRPIRETYAKERVRLKDLGQLIPNFDLLTGCTALHEGWTLVTRNTKHLLRIEGLHIENWTSATDNEFISTSAEN